MEQENLLKIFIRKEHLALDRGLEHIKPQTLCRRKGTEGGVMLQQCHSHWGLS